MPLNVNISRDRDGKIVDVDDYRFGQPQILEGDTITSLLVTTPQSYHGTFKSATRTDAGTTTLTSPNAGGSIVITDFIISGEKQTSSSVELRFTDDTNNATLFLADQTDVPALISSNLVGRVQGWKNARLDMITTGTADSTCLVVYIKLPDGLAYAEWDALR